MRADEKNPQEEQDLTEHNQEVLYLSTSVQEKSENSPVTDREGNHKRNAQPQVEAILGELEKIAEPPAKLQKAIDMMADALAQTGSPNFKLFWEARNISLKLFRENIPPGLRAHLWGKYSELSKEARRLKHILDEQSAFAVEQIEIAVKALEEDIATVQEHLESMPAVHFDLICEAIKERIDFYQEAQKELNLLNAQASRINALRKELIKTEMRIRQKNKIFQRLSQAGDRVFPRRKELIKEVSRAFSEDVKAFISEFFEQDKIKGPIFELRDEIKVLQGMAKQLTLNTQAFTTSRLQLSECWDKIKVVDKERKKVRAQKKAVFKENAEAVREKIQAFTEAFGSGELTIADANTQLDELTRFMRRVDLGRDEIKALREELAEARKPLQEKMKAYELERKQHEQEREKQKKLKMQEIKEQIESLSQHIDDQDAEELVAERDAIVDRISHSPFSKMEKQELERHMKPLRNAIADAISEKKEKALLALTDNERQDIEHLKEVLEERKKRRQEIKNQIRKASGTSRLGFEQALSFIEQIDEEKERLEKLDQGIKEIEDKIDEISSHKHP